MAVNEVPFNRVVVPSEGGTAGVKFAEFLNIDEDSEITLAEMQSYIYDRLFRLGMVRHVDGSRAHRRRARDRNRAKSTRSRSRTQTRATKAKATKSRSRRRSAKATGRKRSAKAAARR